VRRHDADIQAGMLWAAGLAVDGVPANPNPARVINMSLGGSGSCDAGYQDVVNRITAAGVVIVAAAGNSAGGPVGVPANCSGVIGVLALRHAGSKVGFSDLGPQITHCRTRWQLHQHHRRLGPACTPSWRPPTAARVGPWTHAGPTALTSAWAPAFHRRWWPAWRR
jgi:subtilisin family serine protease